MPGGPSPSSNPTGAEPRQVAAFLLDRAFGASFVVGPSPLIREIQ
jgi:hypothetical protein